MSITTFKDYLWAFIILYSDRIHLFIKKKKKDSLFVNTPFSNVAKLKSSSGKVKFFKNQCNSLILTLIAVNPNPQSRMQESQAFIVYPSRTDKFLL